jgi:hypothetical protein
VGVAMAVGVGVGVDVDVGVSVGVEEGVGVGVVVTLMMNGPWFESPLAPGRLVPTGPDQATTKAIRAVAKTARKPSGSRRIFIISSSIPASAASASGMRPAVTGRTAY